MNFDELVAGAAVTFWCLAGLQVHQASGVSPFLEEQICADSPYRCKGFLLYVGNRRARQFPQAVGEVGLIDEDVSVQHWCSQQSFVILIVRA